MLIFNENNEAIILDNIHTPVISEFFWVLDLEMMDYTLTPFQVLEETLSPALTVVVNNFQFVLPTTWNLLIYEEETHQVDVVDIASIAGKEFNAFTYGPDSYMMETGIISAVDYHLEWPSISPSLNKNQMLCHPIGPKTWINIAPSDGYNKYLKNMQVGDIIG